MARPESDLTAAARIESSWTEGIPMARQMGARIVRLDDCGLVAQAPFAKNCNHLGTGFGGSLHALATLAGWGMVVALLGAREAVEVVIQESRIKFLRPVTDDFQAECPMPAGRGAERFLQMIDRRGRARIEVEVTVRQGDAVAAEFSGVFVAIRQRESGV